MQTWSSRPRYLYAFVLVYARNGRFIHSLSRGVARAGAGGPPPHGKILGPP
jgi:hypothetical protein